MKATQLDQFKLWFEEVYEEDYSQINLDHVMASTHDLESIKAKLSNLTIKALETALKGLVGIIWLYVKAIHLVLDVTIYFWDRLVRALSLSRRVLTKR